MDQAQQPLGLWAQEGGDTNTHHSVLPTEQLFDHEETPPANSNRPKKSAQNSPTPHACSQLRCTHVTLHLHYQVTD